MQCGACTGQSLFVRQPARQCSVSGSQTGADGEQSAFERHVTHVPLRGAQSGALAGQSLFDAHCTHRCCVGSHTGRFAGQSLFVMQPTHAPVPVLQSATSPEHCVPAVHDAWHW
jgi:hypothetical protein